MCSASELPQSISPRMAKYCLPSRRILNSVNRCNTASLVDFLIFRILLGKE
jgi:hypothetical protein